MQIFWRESSHSTQRELLEGLKSGDFVAPVCIATVRQDAGIGSRGNSWIGQEGNLFFSFAVARNQLPDDLKLESASIYFMFLLKEVLAVYGSEAWLKWPNDLYVDTLKIGGCITNISADLLVCGIGLNTSVAPQGYGMLDVTCKHDELLEAYLQKIENPLSWKQVFIKYKLEFELSSKRITHTNGNNISLIDAQMMEDGSLLSQGRRIYSQR